MTTHIFGTLEERFWPKVAMREAHECWEWLAFKLPAGYGTIKVFGVGTQYAHRASYELSFGPIPVGMLIDHICHNKSCVNPAHLRLATPRQNQGNRLKKKSASASLKGVCWDATRGKWRATIMTDLGHKYLGRFSTEAEAHAAYCTAADAQFGEFANYGAAK